MLARASGVEGDDGHGNENGPQLSIVCCVRNMAELLPTQLRAVLDQRTSFPFELIVVDNDSTDGSREVALRQAGMDDRVRVIEASPANVNVARNRGIAVARAPVIALCDADDQAEPGWAQALVDAWEPGCYVGGALRRAALNSPRQQRRWGEQAQRAAVPIDSLGGRPSPTGANCCFPKALWEDLGGFDESLLSGGFDETQFFARAALAGYGYRRAERAVMRYRLPATAFGAWRRGYRYGWGQWGAAATVFGPGDEPSTPQAAKRLLVLVPRVTEVLGGRLGTYELVHLAGYRTAILVHRIRALRRPVPRR